MTHNPDQLTPEQVGVSEGWRLLNKGEILIVENSAIVMEEIEYWTDSPRWNAGCYGNSKNITYRTKLTPSELLRARGLTAQTERK